jgi:hypothetical protein
MADDLIDDQPEDYAAIADQLAAGVLKNLPLDKIRDMVVGAMVQAKHGAHVSIMTLIVPLAKIIGEAIVELEEPFLPVIAAFVAPIVAGLFGSEASAEQFASRSGRGDRGAAAEALVALYMTALAGDSNGEIEPGDDGAKRIATAAVHATLEGSFQALATTIVSDLIPFEAGHFDELLKLPEDVIRSLGISRLVRRAIAPLVDATAATPMRRFANKKYRPNLLSEGDIARAFLSGDYTDSEAAEELAQLGYNEKRQAVILKGAIKWMSIADSLVLVRDGFNDRSLALENARLQGFDDVGAEAAVLVEEVKHQNAIRDDSAAAIKAAYVDRRIDDGALSTYLDAIYANDEDRAAYITAWRTTRDLNMKRLSPSEALSCVKAKVLPIAAYREALRLDGYDEESVLSLELLLETQLDANAEVDKLREQKTADAAAAKKAAADAAAKKAAEVDAARELQRRGSLADLKRAVVRGLIPTSRYAEVLTPQYDSDTVNTLVALVEQERADYVAQQAKADDAAKRASLKHIDVGALQTAYLDNILTIEQVGQRLADLNFAPDDAQILVATMQAKKADLDAATAQRADAAAKAKVKSIDLGRFEALVRAGHRTIGDYSALLSSLGYDDGSVAAMVDLLNVHIAEDQKARDARAAAAGKADPTGLTLDQIRRAVILGVKSEDDFSRYLVDNKYTVDAQGVLVAELRDDIAAADAARQKREAAAGASVQTRAPLATIARAARLGIVSPDVYAQRLTDAGYTDDDISIELDLLAVEIADAQAARAKAAAAEAKTADRGLSLDQLARAVKLGAATMDDYRARALSLGYSDDDVATLVQVLGADLQSIQDAQARHDTIGGQLTARNLSLSELDDAVKNNLMSVDAYNARLLALGYTQDDADLLTTLLLLKLPAGPAGG